MLIRAPSSTFSSHLDKWFGTNAHAQSVDVGLMWRCRFDLSLSNIHPRCKRQLSAVKKTDRGYSRYGHVALDATQGLSREEKGCEDEVQEADFGDCVEDGWTEVSGLVLEFAAQYSHVCYVPLLSTYRWKPEVSSIQCAGKPARRTWFQWEHHP